METLSLQTEKVFAYKDELLKFGGTIAGTIILAFVLIKTGDLIINRILKPRDQKFYFDERRLLTLKTLAKSILRYAVYFIVGFTVLGQIAQLTGTDLKGFLAGAGILGVALGIGAQSLVRDIITGFFILLENQYVVGEYITTGGFSGFVEEIELRVTKLRDWGGEYHIIPNGQITAVTNFSRGNMRALVEIGIAYEEDIDRALDVMQRTAAELAGEFGDIIAEGPEVLGVVAFGPSEVVIRTVAKTRPMEQWRVERELRKRFKEAFDREGIEIPYPRQVIITGSAEDIQDTAGVAGSGAEYHGNR